MVTVPGVLGIEVMVRVFCSPTGRLAVALGWRCFVTLGRAGVMALASLTGRSSGFGRDTRGKHRSSLCCHPEPSQSVGAGIVLKWLVLLRSLVISELPPRITCCRYMITSSGGGVICCLQRRYMAPRLPRVSVSAGREHPEDAPAWAAQVASRRSLAAGLDSPTSPSCLDSGVMY